MPSFSTSIRSLGSLDPFTSLLLDSVSVRVLSEESLANCWRSLTDSDCFMLLSLAVDLEWVGDGGGSGVECRLEMGDGESALGREVDEKEIILLLGLFIFCFCGSSM